MGGRLQQDAHECFSIFLDILHEGTQYTLFDDGGITDGIASIKKELFSSLTSAFYDCCMCGAVSKGVFKKYGVGGSAKFWPGQLKNF